MANEMAKRREAEEAQSKTFEGKLLMFLKKLKLNTTPAEFSLAGIAFKSNQTPIIAKYLAYNDSLVALNLARKGI